MRNGAATFTKAFPEALSLWTEKVRNVGTFEAFWLGKTIVIIQDYVGADGWNAFTPTTDDGQIGLTLQAIAERCGVEIPVAVINEIVQS